MKNQYDLITFGAASRDIFVDAYELSVGDFKKDKIEKEILLPFGSKIEIKTAHFFSGGGGTNSAVTFAEQGLKVAYCGMVGNDLEGEAIIKELKKRKIETKFISKTTKKPTNFSVILSVVKGRTILVYRGASQFLSIKDIPWSKIKDANWFYLAPFADGQFNLFQALINFAQKNQIKTMVNFGLAQIKLSPKGLYPFLKKIDILTMNQEEGQRLVSNNSLKEEKLVKKIKNIFSGILIITNGEKRVLVSDEKFLYSALPLKQKVIDTTGAGDAFASGFLSAYIQTKGDVVYATQMALANSSSCIKKYGAKEGLLRQGQRFQKVKVTLSRL